MALADKIETKTNPYAAFMRDCFIEDAEGPGVGAGAFLSVFKEWCGENRRHDLAASATGPNLIKEVRKIEQWKHLNAVKPHDKPRRYPGITRKAQD